MFLNRARLAYGISRFYSGPHSSLSTPPDDLDSFYELNQCASTHFQLYQSVSNDDDTTTLLKLFIKYLLKQETLMLMNDIITQDENISLQQLRFNLVDILLISCKLLPAAKFMSC